MTKPDLKVIAGAMPPKSFNTDTFQNFQASLGINANNVSAYGTYTFDFTTKNRILLEAIYRSSWIIGVAVDAVGDDMTQSGIDIHSTMPPDQIEVLQQALVDMNIWQDLNSAIKWSRLFGGAIAVMMVDGHDYSTPLNVDSIGRDQFLGLAVLDRWQLIPNITDLVRQPGAHFRKPRFYQCVPDGFTPNFGNIHYSRVIRFEGIELPHYQKITEMLWGESIVERIHDRLMAFDSTTTGAAQLAYRAHIRTLKVKDLRTIIATGGDAYKALVAMVEMMRRFQTNEGITMLDAEDEYESDTYAFDGLSDLIMSMGMQLSGAIEVPLVRLFGQSPAGLNSTGESDLRTYYDGIRKKQNTRLKSPLKTVLDILHRSLTGAALPDGFNFDFRSLWQTSDDDKANIGKTISDSVMGAFESGLISKPTALRELRQSSQVTGLFTNISDEDITDAENEPPPLTPPELQDAQNNRTQEGETGKPVEQKPAD